MSGADDLRTAIKEAVSGIVGFGDEPEIADAVLAVLGDPMRRLAILNLVGDVFDETVDVTRGQGSIVYLHLGFKKGERVLVVRPRGEATDA